MPDDPESKALVITGHVVTAIFERMFDRIVAGEDKDRVAADAHRALTRELRDLYRAGRRHQRLEDGLPRTPARKPAHYVSTNPPGASYPCPGCDRCDGQNWT